MGRAADIEGFLAALDPALLAHGFRRRKKAQEWVRNSDDQNRDSIHINFGLDLVNPSVSVQYRDLAAVLPKQFGSCHASAILKYLIPRRPDYSFATSAAALATDVAEYGLPFLDRLHDREFAIRSLLSELPDDWCVFSYSHRIRLLPLLLVSVNRNLEAIKFVEQTATEAGKKDQLIPPFSEFASWFRRWVEQRAVGVQDAEPPAAPDGGA